MLFHARRCARLVGRQRMGRGYTQFFLRFFTLGLFNISISIQIDQSIQAEWKIYYNESQNEPISESIEVDGCLLLEAKDGNVTINETDGGERKLPGLSLRGSALEALNLASSSNTLNTIKNLFSKNLVTFELFSPESLKRQSVRSKNIGRHGENLAGFTADLEREVQTRISDRMQEFYPSIERTYLDQDLISKLYRQNAKETFLREPVPSSQFSDGFTRVLAIVTEIESSDASNRVLLIDEIENGIHPELMGKLIDYLLKCKVQVIATTHSPLILNYLTDDQARESVLFLYRNKEGRSRSCRYFDLPSPKMKLGILGPGEVYVDTSIEQLAREAEEMELGASTQAGAPAE